MFEKVNKKALTGLVLAGILTVGGITTAFAADQPGNKPVINNKQFERIDVSKMSSAVKSALEGLVTAGTITQAQADVALKALTPGERKGNPPEGRMSPLDGLVTAGTITQVQADAINTAMKSAREDKKSMNDVLKELVTAGTITQAQSDAVQKIFTPGERKGNPPEGRKSPADELVTAGTITQAQADAINTAIKSAMDTLKEK